MSMLEDGIGGLQGRLEGAALVHGRFSPGVGDDLIAGIQDGDKTGIAVNPFTACVFRPAYACIDILSVRHCPADIHTGKVYATDEFTVEREDLETVLLPGS